MNRLHPLALALASGVLWGLAQGLVGLTAALFNYGTPWITLWGSFYIGYAPTLAGSALGLLWGFVDGFVGAYFFALLFNFFAKRLRLPGQH